MGGVQNVATMSSFAPVRLAVPVLSVPPSQLYLALWSGVPGELPASFSREARPPLRLAGLALHSPVIETFASVSESLVAVTPSAAAPLVDRVSAGAPRLGAVG